MTPGKFPRSFRTTDEDIKLGGRISYFEVGYLDGVMFIQIYFTDSHPVCGIFVELSVQLREDKRFQQDVSILERLEMIICGVKTRVWR
jgi:hypothetical protein